jgi:hypothetical protein
MLSVIVPSQAISRLESGEQELKPDLAELFNVTNSSLAYLKHHLAGYPVSIRTSLISRKIMLLQ